MGDAQPGSAAGPYARLVLAYNEIFKRLVDAAKNPGAKLEDWSPLAEFVAVDEFERIGSFKEVVDWPQYIAMVHKWATGSHWESTFKGISEIGRRVFLELEERVEAGGHRDVINSLTVWEFNEAGKLVHLDIYLQQAAQPQWASGWEAANA